jgi:hypothetical protein
MFKYIIYNTTVIVVNFICNVLAVALSVPLAV